MSKQITQEELESYLWGSAVLLRNHIDAGSYKQYIFPLLFFKRLNDVHEEETAKAIEENGPEADSWEETHSFVLPKDAHWNSVRNVTQDVVKAIQDAFRAIEKANPDKLHGIFGDGTWTNKRRLPDRLLKDLLEHFSSKTLSLANCPEDELGRGYEYLIKKFADDSGHTAQEFYTNRTVVHLMAELLEPQPGESIYDPTCGSAGMLVSSIAHLKEQHKEWRNVSLYGQEFNALTCSIGRMNLFLHGIEDFHIVNGDTLAAPAFVEGGRLKQFDVVLANPPYSISQWNRKAFEKDPYGRNFLGVPPQGRADYAFFQHILKSMKPDTQGAFDPSAWKQGMFDTPPSEDKRICTEDFYMCRGNGNRALVGVGVYSTEERPDLVYPDTVIAAHIDKQKVCLPYLCCAWKQHFVRDQIEAAAKTTNGIYKINQKSLSQVQIILPPLTLQHKFSEFLFQTDKAKSTIQNTILSLQSTKRCILENALGTGRKE